MTKLSYNRERSARKRAEETPEQREARLAYLREYRQRPGAKARDAARARRRRANATPEQKARQRGYSKKHYATNENARIAKSLRTRLYQALQTGAPALDYLGCTIDEFKTHIAQLFQDGMSWDNHGDWHLDHVVPLASFDLTDPEQLRNACHFTNLQPLWAQDNLTKGAR